MSLWVWVLIGVICADVAFVLQSPCKGCLKRSAHPNCHITCDLYADFVHFRQTYNDQRQKSNIIFDYIKRRNKKNRR